MSHRAGHIFRYQRRTAALAATVAILGISGAALAAGTTLTTEKAKPGKVLVTSTHRALYMFSKDTPSRSACTGSCLKAWPALLAAGKTTVASRSGLNPKLLGTIKVAGGRSQITYNHHRLYMFSGDKRAGETKGEGANAFGGRWYLLSPAGNAVKPKSSTGCPPGFVHSSTGCVPGGY